MDRDLLQNLLNKNLVAMKEFIGIALNSIKEEIREVKLENQELT